MDAVRFKRIEVRNPRTDPHPEKSMTGNSAWRKGLFVVFEDHDGYELDWMPRWDEMETIMFHKEKIDELNKMLFKRKPEAE